MIGWVAKDTSSVGFPTSIYGAQRAHDPASPRGRGRRAPGRDEHCSQIPQHHQRGSAAGDDAEMGRGDPRSRSKNRQAQRPDVHPGQRTSALEHDPSRRTPRGADLRRAARSDDSLRYGDSQCRPAGADRRPGGVGLDRLFLLRQGRGSRCHVPPGSDAHMATCLACPGI